MPQDISTAAAGAIAAVAGAVSYLFGGIDSALVMLFVFSAIDYLMGTAVACRGKGVQAWDRRIAADGFTRKLAMMGVVIVVNLVDQQFQANGAFRMAAVLGYSYIEGTSILRHARTLGLETPPGVDGMVEHLRQGGAPAAGERKTEA